MRCHLFAVVIGALLCGCADKEGPTDPLGPAGPGTSTVFTATVATNGRAAVTLLGGAAANPARPPVLSCYLSDNPAAGVWLTVSDGNSPSAPFCGLGLSNGVWQGLMFQAPVGWTAAFVVLY